MNMIHSFLMQMKGLLQLVGGFTTAVSKNDMFNFSNSHRISLRLFVGGKSHLQLQGKVPSRMIVVQ